jgi:hypothetical protein
MQATRMTTRAFPQAERTGGANMIVNAAETAAVSLVPEAPAEHEDGEATATVAAAPAPAPASISPSRGIPPAGSASIAAMERLIGELQVARDYLQSEGERIERETARYNQLSETASASVKIISASLGRWRESHAVGRAHAS